MYDLLITSTDAQPLSYGRLVGAKATFEPPLSLTKNYISLTVKLHLCVTVEPRCNDGPRDFQNLFAIIFHIIYFTSTGVMKILCYIEDFVIIEVPLYLLPWQGCH